MIRARFKANYKDYRPVKRSYPHPYWRTGESFDESYSIVVAYADNEEQIREFWPEAEDIDSEERNEYTFTSRFPKPDWFEVKNEHKNN